MQRSNKSLLTLRLLGLTASIAGLFFLLHRIHVKALAATFHTMRSGSFLLATLLFGFLFIPAAIRWHLALKANGASIKVAAATRLSLIGHFFYTIFFGAAGGDAAKSALYSRWHDLPLTKILATSSLDRLLGLIGLIVFTAVAFGLAITHGALKTWNSLSLRWPASWLIAALVLIAILVFWLKQSASESPQVRFLKTLSASGRRLFQSPRHLCVGIICAIAVQAALSGVLALCLAAVSPEPLPWAQLAWTFPVISVVSALPITFAGLGVRDSASVALFGLSHVSASTAIAASLLTAAVSLIWALIGAGLLWREAMLNDPDFQFRDFFGIVPR